MSLHWVRAEEEQAWGQSHTYDHSHTETKLKTFHEIGVS